MASVWKKMKKNREWRVGAETTGLLSHLQDDSQSVEMLPVVHHHDSSHGQSFEPVHRLQNGLLESKTCSTSVTIRSKPKVWFMCVVCVFLDL